MIAKHIALICAVTLCISPFEAIAADAPLTVNSHAAWKMGPPSTNAFFPIAVWLQNPQMATRYRNAGFNLYVGLWNGPTEEQLATLKSAGMKVICEFNGVARKHLDDPTIVGWMHGDEPDNAQSLGEGKGYGPPIEPKRIVADYEKIRQADPTRPVMLNLGQGVAWDGWYGRGVRSNHPEDYAEYIKGGDIISFDIYPVASTDAQVAGKLDYVAKGVQRLVKWSDGKKIVWDCIECTRISNPKSKATPAQVRTEVWMSLIHGSMGLIYFVHEWTPKFNESALLDDPEMLSAITDINHQIQRLAPVLNAPTPTTQVTVKSDVDGIQIAVMCKKYQGELYLFAVNMTDKQTSATFTLEGAKGDAPVTILDEARTVPCRNDTFTDAFASGAVHIYKLRE